MATAVTALLDSLSPYAKKIIAIGHDAAQQPIRAELFGSARFEEHGRSLAKAQVVQTSRRAYQGPTFFPRVKENITALRQAYDYISVTSQSGHYVTPAAEWLLDNFYLIEAQLQQIEDGVPKRYFADLPKLIDKPLEGLPRIYGIAWAYVAHTDSVLDTVLFTAFLKAYQEVGELNLGELWALPTTLRVVLLENLRRMADRIARNKVGREVAHAVWDSSESLSPQDVEAIYALMQKIGLERVYLAQMWQRMSAERVEPVSAITLWTDQHCQDVLEMINEGQATQVSSNLTVSNIISNLRLIGQIEWSDIIEPVSRSLQVLRRLPSFSKESELTRQQITHAMERLAQQTGVSERIIAETVVAAAGASGNSDAAQTAGYYLIGTGRELLMNRVRQTAQLARPFSSLKIKQAWRLPVYLAVWLAGTLALLAWAVHPVAALHGSGWLAVFLMAWPASEAVASLIHRLIAESTRVQLLARLDFTAGIPAEHSVLVVLPSMLSSVASNSELTHRLGLHWLASREENAQFALLTDWNDADSQTLVSDQGLLDDILMKLAELNASYPVASGAAPRFLLLHRSRTWAPTEGRWIGWERKRGKLEMLLRLLATGSASPADASAASGFMTVDANMRLADNIRYVLTLDSDTGLPAGSLRELVSIAAHPLNAPQIDRTGRRVIAGYGILQPRVVTPLASVNERSPFHAMFAGQCGLDPYSSDASDLYQDLFGLGTFTGKGLLNVAAVHAVLDRRLPDGAVLSHDLLEGSIARCGYASDVIVMEDQPHHAGVAASRVHRWTRGDWQLIPFIQQAKYFGIDALGAWRMLDNLRRSLIAPASFLLLVWVVFTASIPFVTALSIIFCAYWVGPGVGALAGLVPTRRGIAWVHFFDVGMRDLLRSVVATLWQLSQLLAQARLMLDAIFRALWRMLVSRKHLLEWTTAAQVQAAAKYTRSAFARNHATTTILGLALAAAAVLSPPPWWGMALFLSWAAAPLTAYWASKPVDGQLNHKLKENDREYLLALARQTWHFFETTVGPEDHFLPPDNLQMDPEPTIAHRTSPTNIGLYLLAVASAHEFGWISTAELITRLEATLGTIEQLPKNDGHLFNWYETRTLEVLSPAYVSTVDSGNLAGHLLTLAQACRQFAHHGTSHQAEDIQLVQAVSLQNIAERCTRLFRDMNFSGLYSAKRHLFHIGLRVHEKSLDKSYYDLIASEARLTSFLAIAKGDVPRRHWTALGRSFLTVGVTPGLKSWSGSMFEYLMPSLIMTEPDQGLLHVSGYAAVLEQQTFGRSEQLPWGASESAYFAQDHTLAYQYAPFGVPRLALRRTPILDRVVAPYASVMASMFMPQQAVANLKKFALLGARGKFGFVDAVDFTVSRQADAQVFSLVNTFMAHHQGMSLVALCNVLCDGAPRRWFASAPLVQAFDSLLHEKTPRQIIETADPRVLPESQSQEQAKLYQARDINPRTAGQQPTQLLSNGCYSVVLRPNGAGVSRWHGHNSTYNISRWRDDLLRDQYGSFIYVREDKDVQLSSITYHPAPHPDWQYKATFLADRVSYQATSKKLEINTTVLISPEDDTELRMMTLQNLSGVDMTLEVISYFEAVLADAGADEAHPAFSNLFLQTEWHPQWRAMMLTRKPRLQGDSTMAVAHFLAESDVNVGAVDFLSDRRSFLGRGRTQANPVVQSEARTADGAPINGLDPIAGLRVQVRIPAGATTRLSFATAAASTTDDLALRIDKYLQPMHVKRAKRMAATLAQVRLRDLGLTPEEIAALQDLNTALIYTSGRPVTERASVDLRQLWRFGLSGDKPIILVRIHSSHGLGLVHTLLRAQSWWSFCGLAVDLVILNSEVNSYLMPLQRDILNLRDRTIQQSMHSFPRRDIAGFYLLAENEVSPSERATLSVLARIVLVADGRPLAQQVYLQRDTVKSQPYKEFPATPFLTSSFNTASKQTDILKEPQGFFEAATGEFQFQVDTSQRPRRPWVNVISNASFGCQVSEAGAGYTWAVNSRMQQLTPWSNDPVQDPGFEHFILQDRVTHELLALTPSTEIGSVQSFRVRHGQGYSVFECTHGQLELETTFFVDMKESVKFVHVQLHNAGSRKRHLRAHGLVEWQMGTTRKDRRTVSVWKNKDRPVLYAQQCESRSGFGASTAFLALTGLPDPIQWTCDRSEFFNSAGQLVMPASLNQKATGSLDPGAALFGDLTIQAGQRLNLTFMLGFAADAAQAEQLAQSWQTRDVAQALDSVKTHWSGLLEKIQVKSPDPLFDALMNRWLLYQTLTSRLWAKAGFYQAGGAFGFRDQLQDAMAFAISDPQRLRDQIVLNASRQFPEGDVQHWWHAPSGEGVRTHFSDDLLWLPYACVHYIEVTGDAGLLDQDVHFIEGPAIAEGAEDAYYTPLVSQQSASVYEHCALTIDKSLATGVHGLPLMGTGDWNDGMNRVGHEGRGESVWLAWFLCAIVDRFAPLAESRGEGERAAIWRSSRGGWITAVHSHGWDGEWFRRAFFDNGAPLGSKANAECRIDLIAQAWAVLSNASTDQFTQPAMRSMNRELIDRDAGLLRLLTPPFSKSENNPGYIQAYPPGVRENGGQYAHAAVWAMMAQAKTGDAEGAWESFKSLSPAHRHVDAKRGPLYELEPYVMAGDIYGAEPYVGRGGWSWYTGSAAWLYRAGFENLLGLQVREGQISLSPCLPAHWPCVDVTLNIQNRIVHLRWQRMGEVTAENFKPDRTVPEGQWLSLADLPARSVLLVQGLQTQDSVV